MKRHYPYRKHVKPITDTAASEAWQDRARAEFPDLSDFVFDADFATHLMWHQLLGRLEAAYEIESPDDIEIAKIYGFADWMMEQGEDIATETLANFYENLPDPRTPRIRRDVARWIDPEFFAMPGMVFYMQYGLGSPEAYELFRVETMERYRELNGTRSASNRKSKYRSKR